MEKNILQFTSKGIYCPEGDFFIDPWWPVDKAIITHAHSDHARRGMASYISTPITAALMRARISNDIEVHALEYGEPISINGVRISLHPAGHIPGSAQVRIEKNGFVSVVSGDYKVQADGISTPIEPVRCHEFVTESTFGLPSFRWAAQENVLQDILKWWRTNAEVQKNSVLIAYALGKAQRLIKPLSAHGRIIVHGAVYSMNHALNEAGVQVPLGERISEVSNKKDLKGVLVVAPPSAIGTPWLRRFQPFSIGIASGWMAIRGIRRRRAADVGFVLSDHADWSGLLSTIRETGAHRIYVTHGYSDIFARFLCELGYDAHQVETRFTGEAEEIDLTVTQEDTQSD
ncbi:ligase-associated DNA damage response exonuclease [Thermaurantimonas aggregans]|uniref:ligase-associated DNA damage response exonuclease n=1 Tax=Thermaurantimonas aggregans TaxID=2173829 RepID=UPI001C3FC356|nr:ligase-associated DNA damage response exonuclease [Thermaurantimonas aggregans]MCX8148265.1 ligase-associated DNA damage response exonuclease [Thermaurantimonas aggregans]